MLEHDALSDWEHELAKRPAWRVRGRCTWSHKDRWGMLVHILLWLAVGCMCAGRSLAAAVLLVALTLVVKSDPIRIIYALSAPITLLCRNGEFLDVHAWFPACRTFEAKFGEIRAEVDALLARTGGGRDIRLCKDTFSGENSNIGRDTEGRRGWHLYVVKIGDRFTEHARRDLPTLVSLLEGMPTVRSCNISILDGHTYIPLHCGYFKGALRYMLACRTPAASEACALLVNGKVYHWAEGKSVLWDDTYPHLVRNDADEMRVVLYMDILRPLPAGVLYAPLRGMQNLGGYLLATSGIAKDELQRTELHKQS